MSKPNLGNFKTPTGATGNIFNIGDWGSLILGAIMLIVTFAVGQNLAGKLGNRAPIIDTTIEQPWVSPQPVAQGKQKVIL